MASKRMFNLSVIDTDAFLEMPLSTQALYFHLNLRADDDGFVGSPKVICRTVGASEDDLKLLIAKRFIMQFEDGVIVIKHWRMHNTLSYNRYKETNFIENKTLLRLKPNNAYTFGEGEIIDDSRLIESGKRQIDTSKTRLRQAKDTSKTNTDKNRIDKNRIDKNRDSSSRTNFPTFEEINSYCQERKNKIDPKFFFDYYSEKDWKINGEDIKDWKAVMRKWEKNEKNPSKRSDGLENDLNNFYDYIEGGGN